MSGEQDLKREEAAANGEVADHAEKLSSLSISSSDPTAREATVDRLSAILTSLGVKDFEFKRVPADYHDWTLDARRDILGAASNDHVCKSIVMVNSGAPANITDCSDRNNSKYYIAVLPDSARLNSESIKKFLYALNDQKIPKKKFNMRVAADEVSVALTGFVHNAVTCIGMQTDIPVILDEAVLKLDPDYFFLGGGHLELMVGVRTQEFISAMKPFLVNCS